MKNRFLPRSLPPLIGCALVLLANSAIRRLGAPVHASTATTSSGTTLFHEKGCEHCHGVDGVGIPNKGPSLLTVGKRLKKDAITRQIQAGGDSMPAFGESLQPDEITALVDMLSKKKKVPKGVHAPVGPTPPARASKIRDESLRNSAGSDRQSCGQTKPVKARCRDRRIPSLGGCALALRSLVCSRPENHIGASLSMNCMNLALLSLRRLLLLLFIEYSRRPV